MKKLLLVAAVAVFGLSNANAQEFQLGAKAGANFASLGGDDTDELDARTSFHVGLVAEIMLTDQFAFQPEVLYSSQGAKTEGSETIMGMTYSYEGTTKLDYINVPLLAKYYVTEGLNIHLGPQVGFLVKSESEWEETMDGDTESGTDDIKDFTKGVDFSLAGGLGYKLDMGLFFDARYTLGLSNVWDAEGDTDYSQKNNVFQLSVGFMF